MFIYIEQSTRSSEIGSKVKRALSDNCPVHFIYLKPKVISKTIMEGESMPYEETLPTLSFLVGLVGL